MSLLGILGLGFAPTGGGGGSYPAITDVRSGVVYNDTFTGVLGLPTTTNVKFGTPYGANNTEFIGTFRCGGVNKTPISTNQGVKPMDLVTAFGDYVAAITNLPTRNVVLWCYDGRPMIEGRDWLVWYRPAGDLKSKSTGPVRFGNKFDMTMEVNVVSRTMQDGSQRDTTRLPIHYPRTWYLINALQNLNLFSSYSYSDGTTPPEPADGAYPLTVEPMTMDPTDPESRDQFEEGSIRTTFKIVLPAVLNLSV